MEKKTMSTEAQRRASLKYAKEKTAQVSVSMNRQYDADILAKLDTVENRPQYIRQLIRADIAKQNNKSKIYCMFGENEITVEVDGVEDVISHIACQFVNALPNELLEQIDVLNVSSADDPDGVDILEAYLFDEE